MAWGAFELGSAAYDAYETVKGFAESAQEGAEALGYAIVGAVLPGPGNAVKNIGEKLARQLRHVDRDHLEAAAHELRGHDSGWDHVTEVKDAMNGLRNTIGKLKGLLNDSDLSDEDASVVQALLGRASRALDAAKRAVRH